MPCNEILKGRLPRGTVECISSLMEYGSVKKRRNISRERVGRHDQGGIQTMDVFARHRAFRVADQCCDRNFREAQIIGNAGKAVPQNMWRDAFQGRACENLDPVIVEATELIVVSIASEHIGPRLFASPRLQALDDRQTNGTG